MNGALGRGLLRSYERERERERGVIPMRTKEGPSARTTGGMRG